MNSAAVTTKIGVNGYETLSGEQIGDGMLSRVLGSAAAYYGGVTAAGQFAATPSSTLGMADGLVSGYEIATGDTISDGTFSSILNASHIGVTAGPTAFNNQASLGARAGSGLRVAASAGSLVNTGAPNLQRALRGIRLASRVWLTGSSFGRAVPALQQVGTTIYNARANFVGSGWH